MILFAIIVVSLLHAAALALLFRVRRRNPVFLLVAFNWYFSLGTLVNLDVAISADVEHIYLQMLAGVSVLAACSLFNRQRYLKTEAIFNKRLKKKITDFNVNTVWFLMIISIAVSYVYFQFLVGYNLFLPAISGEDLDFTTMRLQAYAGDTYTGAGIVNQFKNTILPVTFFTIIIRYIGLRRWRKLACFLAVFGPSFLWIILGTGQRTFLFFSLAGFMYSFLVMNRRMSPLTLASVGVLFVALFGAFSLALGRIEDASIVGVLEEVAHRFLDANQVGAVVGFRYVYSKEIAYGSEWLATLAGFLPGVRGSTLSNEVFSQVFGGFRGTIPVSLWTSIYHNFGFLGIFPFTIILIKLVECTHLVLRRIPVTTLHLVIYSFLCFYLTIIPLTSPFQILNNGGLAIVMLFLFAGIQFRDAKIVFRLA